MDTTASTTSNAACSSRCARSARALRGSAAGSCARLPFLVGANCVVPIAVPFVSVQADLVHLGLCDLDTSLIHTGIMMGLDRESRGGFGGADEVHNGSEISQRATPPVHSDETVRSTGISSNQQPSGLRETDRTQCFPPPGDGVHRELGRVSAMAHRDPTLVMSQVVVEGLADALNAEGVPRYGRAACGVLSADAFPARSWSSTGWAAPARDSSRTRRCEYRLVLQPPCAPSAVAGRRGQRPHRPCAHRCPWAPPPVVSQLEDRSRARRFRAGSRWWSVPGRC